MTNNTINSLKNLDAAPERTMTETERARSEALLRSVLADVRPAVGRRATRRSSQRAWGIVSVGAVAAALVVGGAIVAPHLANRLNPSAASGPLTSVQLADWTSAPQHPTGAASATAQAWCLNLMASGPGAGDATTVTNQDQRGQVASMFVHRGGYSMLCITGGDGTGFWELDGSPSDPAPTVASDSATIESAGSHGDGADAFTYVEGYVGSDVTAISVHDVNKNFTATVEDGRWSAWWPTPVSTGGIEGTVTITTRDGAAHTVSGDSLFARN